MAREISPEDDESEDELSPANNFVEAVQRMHDEGFLEGWIKMSYDPSKNPLLKHIENGMVKRVELTTYYEEFPEFFNDIMKASKKHGCFIFLSNFVHNNYPEEIYDTPALLTSQLQYLQVAIMHTL